MLTHTVLMFASLTVAALCGIITPTTSVPPDVSRDQIRPRAIFWDSLVLRYQSSGVNFSDWIELFTLCLAPLIAHLVAGVPEPGM